MLPILLKTQVIDEQNLLPQHFQKVAASQMNSNYQIRMSS